jgi:hypothetical protein
VQVFSCEQIFRDYPLEVEAGCAVQRHCHCSAEVQANATGCLWHIYCSCASDGTPIHAVVPARVMTASSSNGLGMEISTVACAH